MRNERVITLEENRTGAIITDGHVQLQQAGLFDGKIVSIFMTNEQVLALAEEIKKGGK